VAVGAYLGYGWLTQTQPDRADLVYAKASARNVLDLYLPQGASSPVPVVVFVHGGGFMVGDKSDPQSLDALLAAGYGVASINYRLSDTDLWPAQLQDVTAAVTYLQDNAAELGIDGDRMALFGASAGGFLVAATGVTLAAQPDRAVEAVVDWFGPVQFSTMDADIEATGVTRSTGRNDAADSAESKVLGMTVGENPAAADAVSPIATIAALPSGTALPPFLIMHGAKDAYVGAGQSERLRDAILAAPGNAGAEYELLPEGGHGSGSFQEAPATERVIAFLDQHLK
jgi:acetyl esterase/lipase